MPPRSPYDNLVHPRTQKKPVVDETRMAEFRAWMKSQPGFRAAWHTHDSKTGKSLSISVWDDMASLRALKDRVFPGPDAVQAEIATARQAVQSHLRTA